MPECFAEFGENRCLPVKFQATNKPIMLIFLELGKEVLLLSFSSL
jgi:hypothetical protein